jgi:glutathione S-transferase
MLEVWFGRVRLNSVVFLNLNDLFYCGEIMLRLHGFTASNYYNKVKLAMLEKGIAFEEVLVWTDQSAILLEKSPLGKIPFLETEKGILCESQVAIEYIEAAYPQNPLLPADPYEAAKVREMITFLELHLELVMRELYGAVLFDRPISDEVKAKIRGVLVRNVSAVQQLAKFTPYIAGDRFTMADCCAIFHFPLMSMASKKVYGEDLLAPLQIDTYLKQMRQRPHVQSTQTDAAEGFALMIKKSKEKAG